MKNKILRTWGSLLLLPLFVSCNVYSPFEGSGSVDDILEIAQKRLTDGDYAGAVGEYERLPDGTLKKQKLCAVSLSRAGFGLSEMIEILVQKDSKILGVTANAMLPYTADKEQGAIDAAKTGGYCDQYRNDPAGGDEAALLRVLSYLVRCAVLVAKVDQLVTRDGADVNAACNSPGRNANRVIASDIADGTGGQIVSDGMCSQDAFTCRDAFIDAQAHVNTLPSKFADLKTAFDRIPPEIKTSGNIAPVANAIRKGISDSLNTSRE